MKVVRVIPNANSRTFRTVNIVTSGGNIEVPTRENSSVDSRQIETIQDSGGSYTNLKTVCIPGYLPGGGSILKTSSGNSVRTSSGNTVTVGV